MIRNRIKYPLGVCVLGFPWLIGCTHTGQSQNPASALPAVAAQPAAQPATADLLAARATLSPCPADVAAPRLTPVSLPSALPAQPVADAPELVTDAAVERGCHQEEGSGSVNVPAAAPPAEPEKPKRLALFAHAEDLHWLRGQVEISRLSTGCRLRFASMEEFDPHGGSVTLTGDSRLRGLHDGLTVQVYGHLVNPDERGVAPAYHVDRFDIVPQPQ